MMLFSIKNNKMSTQAL